MQVVKLDRTYLGTPFWAEVLPHFRVLRRIELSAAVDTGRDFEALMSHTGLQAQRLMLPPAMEPTAICLGNALRK